MLFLPNIILSHNCHIFISPGQDQHEKTGHYTFSLRFSRIEYYILRFDEPGLIRYGSIFPRYSTIYEKKSMSSCSFRTLMISPDPPVHNCTLLYGTIRFTKKERLSRSFPTPFGQYNHISRTRCIQVLLYAFMCCISEKNQ